jgi:hypothetical protein
VVFLADLVIVLVSMGELGPALAYQAASGSQ